jgi:hypothetical protein
MQLNDEEIEKIFL